MGFTGKHLFALLIVLAGLVSCHGHVDPEGEQTPAEEEILVISADKETIAANAQEIVYFTVMYGTEDVSKSKSMNVRYTCNDGDVVTISAGSPLFATDKAGVYVFHAIYTLEDGTVVESSNTVTVTASQAEIQVQRYERKVLGMQFTSVHCQNCPIMTTYMKEVKKQYEEKVVVASFHCDYAMKSDPMHIGTTPKIMEAYGFGSLPYFVLDMNPQMQSLSYLEVIQGFIDERLEQPAECGVAISTEYDSQKNMVIAETRITSSVEKVYKYAVFLLEDGIKYSQLGVEDSVEAENYVHNNVVRAMMTLDIAGDRVNGGRALSPGQEVTLTRAVALKQGWNRENLRVVSAVLSSENGGSFTCENVNECRFGESVDYYIK